MEYPVLESVAFDLTYERIPVLYCAYSSLGIMLGSCTVDELT